MFCDYLSVNAYIFFKFNIMFSFSPQLILNIKDVTYLLTLNCYFYIISKWGSEYMISSLICAISVGIPPLHYDIQTTNR